MTMSEERIFVVVEQRSELPSRRNRRAFRSETAAQNYIADPENVGTFTIDPIPISDEWEGYDE